MSTTPGSDTPTSRRLLIITNDTIGDRMAGPAIRTWELARVLSQHVRVDLAVPPFVDSGTPAPPDFPAGLYVCHRMTDLKRLVGAADMLMTLGAVPLACQFVTRTDVPLILDAYDPFLLAGLELHRDDLHKRIQANERYRRALMAGLGAADFVVCASERQRDYWLGILSALGRINPHTYENDPNLSRLLRVVPFGLPNAPPRQTRRVLKGVHPAIGKDDRVILWGGGLWDWLDAATVIRAMSRVAASRGDVKLFFMGTKRPNPGVSKMAAVDEALALSRELGLYGRSVIFNDEWVPYAERQNYLLEADVGVCLHRDALETRFAFRTRLLDYLWAGLPAVTTSGDTLGEEMQQHGLAKAVAPGDASAVAEVILELLETPDLRTRARPRFEAMAARYRWEVVASPLVDFCRHPHAAQDRGHRRPGGFHTGSRPWWESLVARARRTVTSRSRR